MQGAKSKGIAEEFESHSLAFCLSLLLNKFRISAPKNGLFFEVKNAKNRHVQKSLIVKDFRFLYIFHTSKSYAFGLSLVAFESVRDME